MQILVTGAYGFIGSHLVAALLETGHEVIGCGRNVAFGRRRFPDAAWIAADFNRDVTAAAWRPRLAGVDAVINCAGILQASPGQSMDAVHHAGPVALFEACREVGVRRVLQISALGAEPEAGTAYADSKHAADRYLAGLDIDWVILKPSLVYAAGSYGGTSLFRGLAALPLAVPLPGGGTQRFQPIHMADLARAVCRLIEPDAPARIRLDAVGPQPMSLREIVLGLRAWLGLPPAPVLAVPMGLVRLTARLGDLSRLLGGRLTMTTTSVRQMEFGNVADPGPFVSTVGFEPRGIQAALAANPAHVQDRWHARLYFIRPLLRVSLGLFWILTGVIAVLPTDRSLGLAMIASLGFGPSLAGLVLWVTAALDVTLGGLLLLRWRVGYVGAVQIAVTLGYLVALSLAAPALWLDPLGPLLKAVPLIPATLVMMALEDER